MYSDNHNIVAPSLPDKIVFNRVIMNCMTVLSGVMLCTKSLYTVNSVDMVRAKSRNPCLSLLFFIFSTEAGGRQEIFPERNNILKLHYIFHVKLNLSEHILLLNIKNIPCSIY